MMFSLIYNPQQTTATCHLILDHFDECLCNCNDYHSLLLRVLCILTVFVHVPISPFSIVIMSTTISYLESPIGHFQMNKQSTLPISLFLQSALKQIPSINQSIKLDLMQRVILDLMRYQVKERE